MFIIIITLRGKKKFQWKGNAVVFLKLILHEGKYKYEMKYGTSKRYRSKKFEYFYQRFKYNRLKLDWKSNK